MMQRVDPGEHLGVCASSGQVVVDVAEQVVDQRRRTSRSVVAEILVLPPRALTTRWALAWRMSRTRGSVCPSEIASRSIADELDAELRVQLDRVGRDGLLVGDLDLLERERQPAVQGLGEHQERWLRTELLVEDGADHLGDAALELPDLRDRRGEADVGHAGAHLLAQREDVIDLAELGRGQVRLVACLHEAGAGIDDLLLGGVELGVVDADGTGHDGGVLGGGEVLHGGTEHGHLRGRRGVVVGLRHLRADPEAAEGAGQDHGHGEHEGDLAAQRPLGEVVPGGLRDRRPDHAGGRLRGGSLAGPRPGALVARGVGLARLRPGKRRACRPRPPCRSPARRPWRPPWRRACRPASPSSRPSGRPCPSGRRAMGGQPSQKPHRCDAWRTSGPRGVRSESSGSAGPCEDRTGGRGHRDVPSEHARDSVTSLFADRRK